MEQSQLLRFVIAALFAVTLARHGLRKKSLDRSGALAALVVGFVVFSASYKFGVALIVFYLTSSKLTKFKASYKKKVEDGYKEGGQRSWTNVLANGGFATLLSLVYHLQEHNYDHIINLTGAHSEALLQAAVLGQFACSNGDTWSSELGILSKSEPRLITTGGKVPRGTNGGISWEGSLASAGGGLLIGVTFYLSGFFACGGDYGGAFAQWPVIALGLFGGLFGSLVDSFLGATMQYSGWCDERKVVVEAPTATSKHISGANLLDNHQVNFLAAALTSGSCAAVVHSGLLL